MKKFLNWWKEEKRYILLLKAGLMALLPIVCCLVYCAMQGKTIGDVYLPCSEWNDELFYFKQMEGIVNYGYPQGYFGFNESHALKLSFAAWSPVLVFPWIIWGLLFGWNLMTPIVCNIVLMTVAMVVFVWLVRPTWKQIGILTLLFCLYTPFVRYMLSGMPEVICFSLLIVFYAIAINYLDNEKPSRLVWMFILSGLLTLMRPYMLLFLLLPAFLWIRKKKWLGVAGSVGVVGVILAIYAMIKHYFGAEYFAPLFFTEWITTFFEEGIGAGIHNFFSTLYWMGKGFFGRMIEGFRSGLASGAFFGGYVIMMLILLYQSFRNWRQKDTKKLIINGHLAFSFVGMLFALLLMYKLEEGSKHLLTFMAVGVYIISLMETKFYKKAVLMAATFAYLYSYMAIEPYDYQVPFVDEQRQAQIAMWEEILDEELTFTEENVPNYENAIIWTLWDQMEDGNNKSLKWQLLYAVPEGYGISCCKGEYLRENFDTLQNRYIAVLPDCAVDKMCAEAGYELLGEDEDMKVYRRY